MASEAAIRGGIQQRQQVAVEPAQQHLAFRIAEADIVFDQLGPIGGDHQPGEQHAAERRLGIGQGAGGGLHDLGKRAALDLGA